VTKVLSWILLSPVAAVHAQVADPTTLNNKIVAGYQGWFSCPGDGGNQFIHWSRSTTDIGPGLYTVDLWPEVSELDIDELFPCPHVTLQNSSMGQLFSSHTLKTVERHFKWMKEFGIDGAFVQRFVVGVTNPPTEGNVLQNVRSAANTHGRIFAVEYDTSGTPEGQVYQMIVSDWEHLCTVANIRNDPRYLHHNGKPVVIIWGLFDDRYSVGTATQIQNFFKNDPTYGNNYCIGGVPGGWRTVTTTGWPAFYRGWHCIHPWTVGGYMTTQDIINFKNNLVAPDVAECNSLGIQYLPVVWPGFSWDNLQQLPPGTSNFPRRGGQHLWDQVYQFQTVGLNQMFVAMFDEVDEGTAILKITSNYPTTDHWIGLEGYPNDWYMRLAGAAARMLRKQIPLGSTIPIDTICNGDEVSFNLGEDVADRMTLITVGDGNTAVTTKCSISCRKNVNTTTDLYMYFGVSDSFAFQGNRPELCVTIDYYDGCCTGAGTTNCSGTGCGSCSGTNYSLHLQYDSIGGGAYKDGGSVTLGNSNTWKRKIYHVTDAYFGNRQNNGADFRIAYSHPTTANFYLDRVLVDSTVAKPPLIQLGSTSPFAHTIARGTQVPSDTFTVINMGVGPLNYTASGSAAWLSASPGSGKSTGERDTLSITYNTATLDRGHYTGAINVADTTATNSPQSVAVNLDVIAFADFDSDGDADQDDFGRFQVCLTDFGFPYAPGCLAGDSNGDGAVDYQDVPAFINCINGPNMPPGC